MLDFLDDELDEQELKIFKKIVSLHFGFTAERESTELVKRVVSWIENHARSSRLDKDSQDAD